ncbi:hypothetical protein SDC9_167044 [bioreactor metagenome]|uniref:Uncharacterized protein n=1 Tax=bioreactor metagenome TaxID=1076179 RepID=A0A645G161_9ZZZZ
MILFLPSCIYIEGIAPSLSETLSHKILSIHAKRLLKNLAINPTINAAITVPSLTPAIFPNITKEMIQAPMVSVVSKQIFVVPNSFSNFVEIAFTKASPDSMTTFAITSRLTPNAKIMHPARRDAIFTM